MTDLATDKAPSTLRTIVELIRIFSTSVFCLCHVLIKTCVGQSLQCSSAERGQIQEICGYGKHARDIGGRRARPYTCHP